MSLQPEILRAQFDGRKDLWKIVKKTYVGSGGGRRFGGQWYLTKGEAERAITRLVNNWPELYQTEESCQKSKNVSA